MCYNAFGDSMLLKDIKAQVRMLMKEWNLGALESGAPHELCAFIYLLEIIEKTEKFVYYRENGELLGYAGYSKKGSRKHTFRKKLAKFIRKCLYRSKKIKDKDALLKYDETYDYVPEELKDYFDGEVSILILDKKVREKGIGKKLLTDIFTLAKQDGLKNLQILTDDSCSYYIYEATGCKCVFETTIKSKEYSETIKVREEKAYIYEKEL